MRKDTISWLLPILLTAGIALALWYYWSTTNRDVQPVEEISQQPVAQPEPASEPGPRHPLPEPSGEPVEKPALEPLPSLDNSDDYFKLALADLFGKALVPSLAESQLIEHLAATVDNLPRTHVAQRMRPVTGVEGRFLVRAGDDSDSFRLDPDNYRRYDSLVGMVEASDPKAVAEVYRRFYPLMQKAYVNLGYPDGYFNDRVIEAIDDLLATPDVAEPPALVRPNVLYEFADPDLEKLSSGQKLLIRVGPEHRQTIRNKLRELRELIK